LNKYLYRGGAFIAPPRNGKEEFTMMYSVEYAVYIDGESEPITEEYDGYDSVEELKNDYSERISEMIRNCDCFSIEAGAKVQVTAVISVQKDPEYFDSDEFEFTFEK